MELGPAERADHRRPPRDLSPRALPSTLRGTGGGGGLVGGGVGGGAVRAAAAGAILLALVLSSLGPASASAAPLRLPWPSAATGTSVGERPSSPAAVGPLTPGTAGPGAGPGTPVSGCDGYLWNASLPIWYRPGCYGHDEPTFTYWSDAPHSGEDASFTTVLPADGSMWSQSDVMATFWYGGVVYDTHSLDNQAFLEFQFYPLQPAGSSGASDCDNQGDYFGNFLLGSNDWFACVVVWQVVGANENAADAGPFDMVGSSTIMTMHAGDHLVVNYSGAARSTTGWTLSVWDVTNRTHGAFTLQGSGGASLAPYWSVADGGIGWGADSVSAIDFAYEIGHANDPAIAQAGAFGACYPGNPPTSDGVTPGACPSYTPADWRNVGWLELGLPKLGPMGARAYPDNLGFTSSMGSTGFINYTTCRTPSNTTACFYPGYSYESNNYSFTYGPSTVYSNDSYGWLDEFPSFNGSTSCASNVNGTNTPAVCPSKNWRAPWATVAVVPTPVTARVTATPGPINQTGGAYTGGNVTSEVVEGWYWINATAPGCTAYAGRWFFQQGRNYTLPITLGCGPPVTVGLQIAPVGGGAIVLNGQTYYNGQSASLPAGTYPLSATVNPGFHAPTWTGTGGVNPSGATGQVTISAAGTLALSLAAWATVVVAIAPPACGPVLLNGTSVPDGGSVNDLPAGGSGVAVSATACSGESFAGWASTAGTLAAPTQLTTNLAAVRNGTLFANFTTVTLYTVQVAILPTSCGPVQINGGAYPNGANVPLLAGSYAFSAPTCAGEAPRPSFQVTGAVQLDATGTLLTVQGNGGVSVTYFPPLTATLTGPSTGTVGGPVAFDVGLAGGQAPLTLIWSFGDASGTQNLTGAVTARHTFAAAGTFTVTVWVNDSQGERQAPTAVITVSPSGGGGSGGGGLLGLTGGQTLLLLAVVVAVVAGVLLLLLIRRRRERPGPPGLAGPYGRADPPSST